jgi:hypothetical protein
VGQHRGVIRNVCIHVSNEQPLLADLYSMPSAGDAGLVCTNVRGLNGKRPVFIDDVSSVFFFPYHVIRFLEIPPGAVKVASGDEGFSPQVADAVMAELEPESLLPVLLGGPANPGGEEDGVDLDVDVEIDEEFLQRIRDI